MAKTRCSWLSLRTMSGHTPYSAQVRAHEVRCWENWMQATVTSSTTTCVSADTRAGKWSPSSEGDMLSSRCCSFNKATILPIQASESDKTQHFRPPFRTFNAPLCIKFAKKVVPCARVPRQSGEITISYIEAVITKLIALWHRQKRISRAGASAILIISPTWAVCRS